MTSQSRDYAFARNTAGQVVVRETVRVPETRYAFGFMGACMCINAQRLGIGMMCFMCSGPEFVEVFSWTSGDL